MAGPDIPLFLLGVAASLLLLTFCLLIVGLMMLLMFSMVAGAIGMWQARRDPAEAERTRRDAEGT